MMQMCTLRTFWEEENAVLTPEQIELRKTGVSASEIAAVCGLNPWRGPGDVWADKLGLTGQTEQEQTEDIERGNELEHALVHWTGRRILQHVATNKETFRSKTDELALATPDGFAVDFAGGATATIEVKAPSWRTARDWSDPKEVSDGCPKYYLVQAQWQMGVLGLGEGYVSGLVDGRLWVYRLAFSEALYQALLARAKDFWRSVEAREPPPFVAGQPTGWISEVYRSQADEGIVEPPGDKLEDLKNAAATYLSAQQARKKAELDMDAAKGYLTSLIKEHAGLKLPGYRCTWKQARASMERDWERIAMDALGKLAGVLPVEEIDAIIAKHTQEKKGSRRFYLKEI